MIIIEIIEIKITAWCKDNRNQAKKYFEVENLTRAWAFFNRVIKLG